MMIKNVLYKKGKWFHSNWIAIWGSWYKENLDGRFHFFFFLSKQVCSSRNKMESLSLGMVMVGREAKLTGIFAQWNFWRE